MEVTTSAAKPASPRPTSRESFEADLDAGWDLDEPTRSDDAAPIAGPPRKTSGQFVVSSPRKVESPPSARSERTEVPPPPSARIQARANMRSAAPQPRPGSKSEPCEAQAAIAAAKAFSRFALRPAATGRHDSAPPVIEVAPASDADLAALALMDDSAPPDTEPR
jgi:hypothetical protein